MKKLTLNTHNDFKVWFSSDWHLNHLGPRSGVPLWQSRGYKSPSDMTARIIAKINEMVMPDDYLFYMGDLCLDTTEEMFESNMSMIGCQNIYMLWGNHNSPVRKIYNREIQNAFKTVTTDYIEVYPFRYKNIVFCGDYMEAVVDESYLCMCHYPMDVFNHGLHGSFMLCGHSHGSYEKTRPEYRYNKRLDLSWDIHKRPLSIKEIKDIMETKEFLSVDHHKI